MVKLYLELQLEKITHNFADIFTMALISIIPAITGKNTIVS